MPLSALLWLVPVLRLALAALFLFSGIMKLFGDLVRYTQTGGRVTLPASITGSSWNLRVRIDAGEVVKRAITNRANEEVKKRLGGLFGR